MSDNTTSGENTPEDNELIRKLRSDLKIANQKIKTAAEDAVAQVERGSTAAGLMPEGFKGLADIFASEVDGELDAASAAEWLKGRGFSASSDETVEEVADTAAELQKVTDLGGAVAAAGSLTPEDTILKQLGEVVDPNAYQSLSDVVEAIDGVLNG
ncbi:MAG: hypothetical protein ACYSW8_31345 [Planctomycetota bacterium]|jgi:hypothetical protein